MENYEQKFLVQTMYSNDGDTVLEFIEHGDLHFWVYINGVLTDVMLQRASAGHHLSEFDYNNNHFELYNALRLGKSKYNQQRVRQFFAELEPESFV